MQELLKISKLKGKWLLLSLIPTASPGVGGSTKTVGSRGKDRSQT